MGVNRRDFMLTGAAAAATGLGLIPKAVFAASEDTQALINAFAGNATPVDGQIKLTAPEIAENGNVVPVSVELDSPMTAEDFVSEIMLLANDNPAPSVVTFKFSPASGHANAATRIRLARTQDIIAVAKTNDGKVYMTSKPIKVTIGGCGG